MTRSNTYWKVRAISSGWLAILLISVWTALPVIASGVDPSAKVFIKETGFYRVSKAQLSLFFSIPETNIATTSFTVMNVGKVVPSIRNNGDIVFYGQRFETQFTDENVYWISVGASETVKIQTVVPGTSPFAITFPQSKRIEQQLIFRADLIRNQGAEQEDPIYWRLISSGLSTSNFSATVAMDNVAPSTGGSIKVRVKGATDISGRFNHRCRLLLNNTLLGTFDFEGLNTAEAEFQVPTGLWTSGNNTLRVQSNPPAGTTFDSFYLDYIEVNYQRTYSAQTNRLNMIIPAGSVEVSSFNNSNIVCWNVNDPWSPRQLVGGQVVQTGTNWKYNFNTTLSGRYAAVTIGSELVPLKITTGSVVNLKSASWQLDHITISDPALFTAGQAIKGHRASQGLQSEIITVDDIYDSFNYGIRDPRSIQSFLGYAYRTWAKAPRYVFLLGDGSLDYKNSLGSNDSAIPSFPVVVGGGMYASDFRFGDIDGDGFVEMAVGRLPVNAVTNVNEYIDKMLNYEVGGGWKTNALITTDQSDYAGSFFDDGNYLEQEFLDREVARADIDVIGVDQTRDALIKEVNSGKEVSLYIGHGTPNQLSLQSILLTSDMGSFTNDSAPSSFVMIGCLVGSFANPAFTSLGEGLIKAKGGAATLVAAATLISAADGKVLTEKFLESIYTEQTDRIGDAWIKGKNELTIMGRTPAYEAFQLLGDPAMVVGSPNAAPPGNSSSPSRGSYQEWVSWSFPSVLQDLGFQMLSQDDPDGDQSSNWDEYMAGTDPLSQNSFLEIVDIRKLTNGQKSVSWPSAGGRSYRLEYAPNVNGPYQTVARNIPATAPQNTHNFTDSGNQIIYRVVVE